eukprot:PRCOL_00003955-RA
MSSGDASGVSRLALLKRRQQRRAAVAGKAAPADAAASSRAPPKYSAARSHELNDAFCERIEQALTLQGEAAAAESATAARAPAAARAAGAAFARDAPPAEPPALARGRAPADAGAWLAGPADPSGRIVDLSDRPLLAASAHGELAVVAGSDHALYEVSLATGRRARKLYTKAHGHSEWVTCVAHASDGRVLSGGMDSTLCLWEKGRAVRAQRLEGHTGSVSAVACGDAHAVSASYDKSLRVWALGASGLRAEAASVLRGHKAPILCLSWGGEGGAVATGARDGALGLWEIGVEAAASMFGGAHQGHVTALQWLHGGGGARSESVLLSGGQDGRIRAWDPRVRPRAALVAELEGHATPKGAGAVGDLRRLAGAGTGMAFASSGADGAVRTWDARVWGAVHTWREHGDFVYCLEALEDLVISGDGGGRVLVHDARTGACAYGLGAGRNAVRALCVGAGGDALLCAGDDGDATIYSFA